MKKYQKFYLKTFRFLMVKFSIYLNRRVFVMIFIGNFDKCGKSGIPIYLLLFALYFSSTNQFYSADPHQRWGGGGGVGWG